VRGKYDITTDEGRVGYLGEATQLLAALPSAVEREVFGRKVAEQTGITAEAVGLEVKKAYKKRVSSAKKKLEREETRPIQAMQPKAQTLRYDDPLSAKAEEGIIRLLFADPALIETNGLTEASFTSPFLQKVYGEILRRYADGAKIEIRYMEQAFSPDEIAWLTQILRQPETKQNTELAMQDYIDKIKTERLKHSGPDAIRELAEKYRSKKGYGG
jgi:DNA primase